MSTTQAVGDITPVILSGGSGTRLWPLSRAGYPKQFLPFAGPLTLFQDTVERVHGGRYRAPLVICNDEHRFIVAEQLRARGRSAAGILLEPFGRNTAPAVAVAALCRLEACEAAGEADADPLILVMPSDHLIRDVPAFHAAVEAAAPAAAAGRLVTFGIQPDAPETGYGYIQAAGPLDGYPGVEALGRFVEKPDRATAEGYVADGSYRWNSGIFLFPARTYLAELEATHPEMVAACRAALAASREDLTFRRLDAAAFEACPSDSVDYAVMERTRNGAVVPVSMGWNDLGAWSSLWEVGTRDDHGNVVKGDVVLEDTQDTFVWSDHGLVSVVGLDSVVVVTTDDAVLVAHRDRAQDVKAVVERLKAEGRSEHSLHTTVHRPWGTYRGIDHGERFQVKRIVVQPGERLSLQMHHHRAEHWIVVSGTARVTRDTEEFLLSENQSTYISAGQTHRLENPGKIPLHLIEVQSGGYLGEDDIVRFEDGYGRGGR
ncbi:mannose-1-phosphate guanylyltransferase/mannose-6-phosphate isomerase [Roseospira marina]|uniref:mannose-1-phosphate guanylyltransferase n=1 Tax=Roseospira marina TaxID=140057 RepID=A0A5M6I8B6_9PROT|nr:mannose-1-phosphate guanylyltransferase/mannose-6-phosphate isomerase [Roseospira marina]KAA5604167.1 mannose-1-phosphate guanylyltransferase/mannose-6-phosphate isomerase [Roseospira marina]MBB4315735.1 mannose-1-phosphate guanylyltransferase/mannose-6-phosphate isomerase [Roseospira marina]MBB5088902.1 mannose-1-phosphate guanylyltransferase/mannose-6-phosphate isomerase [Roseospira marina]